jgi:D-alanyl-D-alanine carboxypeptidase
MSACLGVVAVLAWQGTAGNLPSAGPADGAVHAAAPGVLRPAEVPQWQELPAPLRERIEEFRSGAWAAGIEVAVSTPEHRYLLLDGSSDAVDGVGLAESDRFAFRSITKTFVGTVVLQLAAEGKLSLDDLVGRYVEGVPEGDRITVRMALAMRSGLVEYSGLPGFSALLSEDYARTWDDRELLDLAFAEPLAFEPGTDFLYSNTNTILLAEVIRTVTGNSWDREVQSRILDPLGLSTVTYPRGNPPAPMAGPYLSDGALLQQIGTGDSSIYSAAGGLFGTVGDLLRWGAAAGSEELLPAWLQRERQEILSHPAASSGPDYDGYGLALGQIGSWWGHTGVGMGYESLVMHDPAAGTTVAILINTELPDPDAAAALFREMVPELEALP